MGQKNRVHTDFIYTYKWFAWRPVHTTNAGWVWFKWVMRTDDERELEYLGLLPTHSYELIK